MLRTHAGQLLGGDGPLQRFLRRDAVEAITALPRSTIYELMASGQFPKQVRLAPRIVGWLESEIIDWQRARVAARDVGGAK